MSQTLAARLACTSALLSSATSGSPIRSSLVRSSSSSWLMKVSLARLLWEPSFLATPATRELNDDFLLPSPEEEEEEEEEEPFLEGVEEAERRRTEPLEHSTASEKETREEVRLGAREDLVRLVTEGSAVWSSGH